MQIFLQCFGIFLLLMCVLKYIVYHTIIRFYTIFFINEPHLKKPDPKVIEKNFDNKKDAHILSNTTKKNHQDPSLESRDI